MPFIKFIGKDQKRYSGFDGKVSINAERGDIVTVSSEKAKQLTEDFPDEFEIVKEDDAPKAIAESLDEKAKVVEKETEVFNVKKGRGRPRKNPA